MGSATREALAASKRSLDALGSIDLGTATSLLEAGRLIGETAQLRAMLADPSGESGQKAAIVERVFGSALNATALGLLKDAVQHRWSTQDEMLGGIEEIGLRAVAKSAEDVDVDVELFSFARVVASDAGLELALGSKLGDSRSKAGLVDRLLSGKASPQAVAIVSHLVQQPRGRRIGELLRFAASVVADQLGFSVATVTSATPLSEAQIERLASGLARLYGRSLKINQVTDPSIVGGLRVQVADDVFDGSIATRLAELRLQLAG